MNSLSYPPLVVVDAKLAASVDNGSHVVRVALCRGREQPRHCKAQDNTMSMLHKPARAKHRTIDNTCYTNSARAKPRTHMLPSARGSPTRGTQHNTGGHSRPQPSTAHIAAIDLWCGSRQLHVRADGQTPPEKRGNPNIAVVRSSGGGPAPSVDVLPRYS